MAQPSSYLRWAFGSLVVLVIAALMYAGTVNAQTGVVVIVGVAAALGVYEGGNRLAAGRSGKG